MPHLPPSQCVTTRVIRQEDEWDALRPEWEALYASSPDASAPLEFAWLRTWWRIYGPTYGADGLHIVTAWRGARLIGALPLYKWRLGGSPLGIRQVQFLSTGEAEYEETCPDYLDVLCSRGEEAVCADAIWDCVERLNWDRLALLNLSEESPLLRCRAFSARARTFARGTCPVADLSGGFEAYLDRLTSNTRQQARRILREGKRAGATFEIVAADQAGSAFDDLVRLHQMRWTAEGKQGVFAAPRFTAFHRDLVREWLPGGRAVLARLSVGGDTVAVLYGFVTGARFEFYQSGVLRERDMRLRSPGNLAHLLLMQTLAERGITAYDFLRGVSSYKERLATRENRLVGVQVWRPTLRGATCLSALLARQVARRGATLLFSQRADR